MKKYGNALRHAWRLIAGNWKTWLLFIAFYNVVGVLVYSSVTYGLYAASLKVAGVTYLASNTMGTYFLCPFTWLFILISIVLNLFIILLQIGALYRLYDASRRGEKIGLTRLLTQAVAGSWKCIRPKNALLFLYLLVMLPVMGMSMMTNMSYSIDIPGFIMSAIKEMKVVYALLCALMVFLVLCTCRLQYSMAALVLDGCSFREAGKKSRRIIKNRYVHSIAPVFVTYLLLCAVFAAAGALVGLLLAGSLQTTYSQAVYLGALCGLVGASVFGPSCLLAQTSALYFEIAEEKGESLPRGDTVPAARDAGRAEKILTAAVFLCCLAATVALSTQDTSLNMTRQSVPEIAAHRGDSGNAPENTMPAFEQAIEDGDCGWIELDVHQTKDGVIVITHDDSLARIDGSDRYVHDMTYDELLQVDFGSRFSEAYAGTRVATLDEVLDYCKDKIKLQIEIKPTEYDDHIEEAVVDLIRDHDMVDSCVVLSLKDTPLRRIKEIDPEITTMYCMAFSDGEVTDIDFAEYISIEEQNVTADLINSMHAQNRQVFVWTIDDTDNLQYLVDCGADVILTDYPTKIDEGLQKLDYSGGFARTLRLLLNA